nr:protein kinase [Paludisphaera mucosa]
MLREVGRGGMGVVYEAEQVSLGRRVALKVLAPWLRASPHQVQRFLREAKSAARLQHPDIVPIFGVGEHEGRHYYAMQFISGHGLDRVLDDVRRLKSPAPTSEHDHELTRAAAWTQLDGETRPSAGGGRRGVLAGGSPSPSPTPGRVDSATPVDAPDAGYRRAVAEIVVHAAEALQYAHDQRMLHRDIKPSNLLLDENGKVWVTDFGLVKAVDGEDLTGTGDIVGTLRYMAPERFRGRCDVRSDVYSLGLTLYEMLALRPAFEAADRQYLIHQITQEEPEPIRRVLPTLPRDLATIVQTAIAPDPEDRYATAGRLAEDLGRWLRHEPIRARRSAPHERLAKWARRNPAVAALAASAALAAIAALTILAVGNVRVSRSLYDSQRLTYFQRIALAERAWSGNDVGRAETLLDDTRAEFRSWEWHYLKRLCNAALATLRANGGEQPDALAFSPDGATAATAGPHGDVLLWEVPAGRRIRTIFGRPEGVYGLAFRPDGVVIASAGGGRTIRLYEVATGREIAAMPIARGRDALAVAWSPDGTTLASCAGVFWETVERAEEAGDLTLWDARTGRAIRSLEGHVGSVHQAAFSPDGGRLASAGADGLVKVWDPATGELLFDLAGHEGVVMGVAYDLGGRRIVSAGLDGTLRTWDAATGAALGTFRDPGERFLGVAWSPDGRRIAAAGRSWAVTVWDAATGRKTATYRGHDREATGVAFSDDGRLLGSAGYDGLVRIWDAEHGQDALAIVDFASPVSDVAVDPKGRWLAAADEVCAVQLRDLATGRPGPELDARAGSHASAAFSPDGARLAAGAREGPGLVEVWDPATGLRLHALEAGRAAVTAVAFGPDSRTLAAGDLAGVVRIWDAESGTARKPLSPAAPLAITALTISPDGRRLAATTGDVKRVYAPGTATVWDLETGREVLKLRGHRQGVADAAFSPDGLSLATASWDNTIGIWDARTGERRHAFTIRGLLVWAVAFTPDGKRVVAADNIGRMTFWDVETGHEVLTLPAHADRIYDLAFGDGGRLLASAGRDAVVKVWNASPSSAPPAVAPADAP